MNWQQIIDCYRQELKRFEPQKMLTCVHADGIAPATLDHIVVLRHVRWMLDQMEIMIHEQGTCEENCQAAEKFNRWLGFVQGVLFCGSYYTIDELREHTRRV